MEETQNKAVSGCKMLSVNSIEGRLAWKKEEERNRNFMQETHGKQSLPFKEENISIYKSPKVKSHIVTWAEDI